MSGLAGHINHLYEDHDIRFRDIKQLFRDLGRGSMNVYEKFDGQNIFFRWDFYDDKIKFARNKQNVKDGGLDRYGLSLKFADRPEIENLFVEAYDVLSKAFEKIDHNTKSIIFGSMGDIWFSAEIINPDFPNTIQYSDKSIIIHKHGPKMFGWDGSDITTNLDRNLECFQDLVEQLNENIISTNWQLVVGNKTELMPIDESVIERYCSEIDGICSKFKIGDNRTLRDYIYRVLRIHGENKYPFIHDDIRINCARRACKYHGAPGKKDILSGLDSVMKETISSMMDDFEKTKQKCILPIEKCVHLFSSDLMKNMKSKFIANVEEEANRIRDQYNSAYDHIMNNGDPKEIEFANLMKNKIKNSYVGMEGLVFHYKDKVYKITGDFAPMNRVIAHNKYKDKQAQKNQYDIPLASFISV